MCLHYLVKLIARVLSPYITYFSIQVVDFWHQIFTNCWNNSFQVNNCFRRVYWYTLYILWRQCDSIRNISSSSRIERQLTELARRSSCWKKSHLISSNQVCGLPIVLILTPSTMRYGESCRRVSNKGKIANVEELRQRIVDEWECLDQRIIDGAVKEWRKWLRACAVLKEDSLNMNCDSWCNSVVATVHSDFAV